MSQKEVKKEECPNCIGAGTIYDGVKDTSEECKVCNGEGKVSIIDDDEDE